MSFFLCNIKCTSEASAQKYIGVDYVHVTFLIKKLGVSYPSEATVFMCF